MVSDKDFKIQGNDGGANVNALSFDMSAAGALHLVHQSLHLLIS